VKLFDVSRALAFVDLVAEFKAAEPGGVVDVAFLLDNVQRDREIDRPFIYGFLSNKGGNERAALRQLPNEQVPLRTAELVSALMVLSANGILIVAVEPEHDLRSHRVVVASRLIAQPYIHCEIALRLPERGFVDCQLVTNVATTQITDADR